MIDRATVAKITEAARIEDVVSDYVTLKRAGANYRGLCPFHDDRTPSFSVSPSRNICKCFACGEGGNPVTFIMKIEQMSYPDALRHLAKKYGIQIEEKELTEEEVRRNDDRESMFVLNEWARKWFRHQLTDTADGQSIGMTYLRERGFRDDILEKFQVGYCPNSRQTSLADEALKAGFQEKYITNTIDDRDARLSIGTGLALKHDNGPLRDRFAGRVIWPIFSISGRVAGFGGRVLDAATKGVAVKYQNSPESLIYSKRQELYGLYQAKQAISREDLCYLVEGYTDVMAMHQSGVENVVASSGTALTDEQIQRIHRLTENIVMIYDGDEAGIKASQRGIDMLLRQGMRVKLLMLPEGEDPDSFARKKDSTEFKEYLKTHQTDFIKFKINLLLEEAKGDPVALSRLVHNIVQSIAVIPDEITRAFYVEETAQTMRIKEEVVANAVMKQVARNREEWFRQRERNERLKSDAKAKTDDVIKVTAGGQPFTGTLTAKDLDPQDTTQEQDTPSDAPGASSGQKGDRLHLIERELTRAIVHYGEVTIWTEEDEDGNTRSLNVIEYIDQVLRQDKQELRDELFRRVLTEAMAHRDDKDFSAEQYFLNHPDQEISALAFDLLSTSTKMSLLDASEGKQKTSSASDDEHPATALVPHLLTDYKLSIVKEQLNEVKAKLRNLSASHDVSIYKATTRLFRELKEAERNLSRLGGDRVIN